MDEFDKYKWLRAIASNQGPREATTRHVLHVLALPMTQTGERCFPSQALVSVQTGYSPRAVRTHLKKAAKTGWIKVHVKRGKGRAWLSHWYEPTFPDGVADALPQAPWEADPAYRHPERSSARRRPGKEKGNSHDRNHVPPVKVDDRQMVRDDRQMTTPRPANDDTTTGPTCLLTNQVTNQVTNHVNVRSQANGPRDSLGLKKLGGDGEEGIATDTEALKVHLAKTIQQYPNIGDATIAKMCKTDLPTVKAARKAAR